jgi:putative colanic acid biosynthesis UDP-glucose lipid carrier transferase
MTRGAGLLTVLATLCLSMLIYRQMASPRYLALGLTALGLSAHLLSPFAARRTPMNARLIIRILVEWGLVVALMVAWAAALNITADFSRPVLATWFAITPVVLCGIHCFQAALSGWMPWARAATDRYVIVGANDVGGELRRRAEQSGLPGKFLRSFDQRSADRLPHARGDVTTSCTTEDIVDFVRRNAVNAVYVTLPMSNSPRLEALVNALRDTTASVYFVPNIFAFDLVQARVVDISGIPAFSICDTPFHGMRGVAKRISDVVLACLALLLMWPVMLAVAVAVKWSSPGPVLFKQRRYGLNGEEILVYKFRSMTVCEDGPVIAQATARDRRVTPVGALLRRTSLDELPQVLNVLEGKMSFVGPRPHAVAHNEEYRKLISGYMIRHKVRPGITGWAQVNGLRGETSTVDKMQARVQYDLDYLKNWSLSLDLRIIARTVLAVLHDPNAY